MWDLTEEIQTFAVNFSLTPTPDLQAFFSFNPGLKTYIEVLSFNKLVKDAKQRNNILFKKLGIYSGFRLYEVHISPLIASDEGVGVGFLYLITPRSVVI